MCGICGWFGSNGAAEPPSTRLMASALSHRGPDDEGHEAGSGWGLGFRRLSILDLSALGHQPMHASGGRYWIVFNGEIYNFLELRRTLVDRGEVFLGTSDTEVLLCLLARHGVDALPMLNGMFAFCFIDTVERTFILARDRLGVKPLYFQIERNRLRFASELKGLLADREAPRTLDRAAIADYLTLGYLPNSVCIFEGYRKLEPGHFLAGTLDAPAAAVPQSYWNVSVNDDPAERDLSTDEVEELEALFLDAVRIRLRSDVPVGIFLSGGIDSGLVAAYSAKIAASSLTAFSVGFSGDGSDESDAAALTARHVGLQHRVIMQDPPNMANVDRLARTFDEPFADASALPTMALCAAAGEHATVFLSGDGGDETFAGYRRYIETRRLRQAMAWGGRIGAPLRTVARAFNPLSSTRYRLQKLSEPDLGAAASFDHLNTDSAIDLVAHRDIRSLRRGTSDKLAREWARTRGTTLLSRQQDLDYRLYLPDDVLVKVDRASMANSIEVRSPLLDVRLVEWAARLPRGTLMNSHEGKLPLRKLARRYLPPEISGGAKRGFDVPLDDWFRENSNIAFLRDRVLSPEAQRWGYFDPAGIESMIEAHKSGRGRNFGNMLWRLLMLDAWTRAYAA